MQKLELLRNTEHLRNVCILAHVDHGKTTLSDSLVATNGFISSKLAGQVRYMDSRKDEQERGITMKSSCITLQFFHQPSQKQYLVHLVDSPGHVDFSSEVFIANQLCDGALLLVDVVEGICTQTIHVLRNAFKFGIKLLLVLNKIDRLILEWKMTAMEAYLHIRKMIEQLNALIVSFYVEQQLSKDQVEMEEANSYFEPEKGNVIFCSAVDGWAFRLREFSLLFASKLGISASELEKHLWLPYQFSPKTKQFTNCPANKPPLAVSIMFQNIWSIYQHTHIDPKPEQVQKIIQTLGLKLFPHQLKQKETIQILRNVMSQFLSLSNCLLSAIQQELPSPIESQRSKMKHELAVDLLFKELILGCDQKREELVLAAKVLAVDKKSLEIKISKEMTEEEKLERRRLFIEKLRNQSDQTELLSRDQQEQQPIKEEDSLTFISICRVFSGTLKRGQKVTVLHPKFHPIDHPDACTRATITNLFLLLGKDFDPISEVPAGNICGVLLEPSNIITKHATLITTNSLNSNLNFFQLNQQMMVKQNHGLLRVAIEPESPKDLQKLNLLLNQLIMADPSLECLYEKSGELILCCDGELHLERCLRDLRDGFGGMKGIPVHVSEPIVPFRECVVKKGKEELENEFFMMTVQCFPVSKEVEMLLSASSNKKQQQSLQEAVQQQLQLSNSSHLKQLEQQLKQRQFIKENDVILAVKNGNLLITDLEELPYSHNFIAGFRLVVDSGPMCKEPLAQTAFRISGFELRNMTSSGEIGTLVMNAFRELSMKCFLTAGPRLQLATYTCQIQTNSESLGKVYAVLNRRNGKVLSEEIKDDALLFQIEAQLPLIDSFGFSEEIKKKTSGQAIPQLFFSGFQLLEQDPFWVPSTKDELEALGEKSDRENLGKVYLDRVKKRKGLIVDEKQVVHAEKQRTLKK